jgi:hypothetical protein
VIGRRWRDERHLIDDAVVVVAFHTGHRSNRPTLSTASLARLADMPERRIRRSVARLIACGVVAQTPNPDTFKLIRTPAPDWYPPGDCPCGAWRMCLDKHEPTCPEALRENE